MLKEKPERELIKVPDEGLISLIGRRVLLMCVNYFYTGTLTGVNETCVELEDPAIVYNTGDWQERGWQDAQALPADTWYVGLQAIESYGEPEHKIVSP